MKYRTQNGSALIIILLVVVVAFVSGAAWYYVAHRSPSSETQTNNATQASVSPKTAEAMQAIQYLVQYSGGTLDVKPITRILHPVSTTDSSTFSLQGITFRVPWTGVSKTGKGNPAVVVSKTFTNGRSFLFMRSVPMSATNTDEFASLSSTLTTAYAITNATLSATPDQVTSSTPGNQAVLTSVLLDMKAMLLVTGGPPIYRFDTGIVRGFQHGDASLTKPIAINIFDQKGTEYTLGIAGTQGEIDYVLASMQLEQ